MKPIFLICSLCFPYTFLVFASFCYIFLGFFILVTLSSPKNLILVLVLTLVLGPDPGPRSWVLTMVQLQPGPGSSTSLDKK